MRRLLFCFLAPLPMLATVELASCGGILPTEGNKDATADVSVVDTGSRLDASYFPDASCWVRIDSPPLLPANHVPIGTDITTWNSNPPSSGDHYPIWAAYQEYDAAVPRGYYVHDLEHGAIDFLYDCDSDAGSVNPDGGCDAIVSGLRTAMQSIPTDPLCDPSIRVRHVITPDPLIDHPVAAAAWGWTYNADCLDLPTLQAFALAHYAQGPEDFCTDGITGF